MHLTRGCFVPDARRSPQNDRLRSQKRQPPRAPWGRGRARRPRRSNDASELTDGEIVVGRVQLAVDALALGHGQHGLRHFFHVAIEVIGQRTQRGEVMSRRGRSALAVVGQEQVETAARDHRIDQATLAAGFDQQALARLVVTQRDRHGTLVHGANLLDDPVAGRQRALASGTQALAFGTNGGDGSGSSDRSAQQCEKIAARYRHDKPPEDELPDGKSKDVHALLSNQIRCVREGPMTMLPKLTWTPWPAGLTHDRWASAAKSLRRRGRVVLLHGADMPRDQCAAWCQSVREAGLIAGISVDIHDVATFLPEVAAWGPLLLVLQLGRGDRPQLTEALASLARDRCPTLRWTTLGVPRCWLGGATADLELQDHAWPDDLRCTSCAERGQCPGPVGEPPVLPRPVAVSNQFDVVLGEHGELALEIAGERCRGAILGATDSAVMAQALDRGQLYLDRSDVARIDDFSEQIQLLLPDGAGVWRPAAGQTFDREEAALRQVIAGLRGLVVDVGAGPVRYLGQLRSALQSGQLRYLAVEPDPQHLARSQTALPEGQFVRGVGEFLPLPDACADAVLWLRSWNHLGDPHRAVAEALRVARPGATLLIVDNVAFGLARRPEQLQRAHAIAVAETPFEHFRNDCATEALQVVRQVAGNGVEVVQIQDVELGTSNQWLLQLRVTPPGRILE